MPTKRSSRKAGRTLSQVNPASTTLPLVRTSTNILATDPFSGAGSGPQLKRHIVGISNQQFYHAIPVKLMNQFLLDGIPIGSNGVQRVGNKIFIKDIEIRLVLNNKYNRPNVTYRLAMTASGPNAVADSFAELFSGDGIVSPHDPNNSKLLFDTIVNPMSYGSYTAAALEKSFSFVRVVNVNRSVTYSIENPGTCNTMLTLWCVAYDAYGTVTTDNIASMPIGTATILFTSP